MNWNENEPRPAVRVRLDTMGRGNAANHSSIRESNLALVASQVLSVGGGLNRAEIAEATGLTKATVSRLVQELFKLGVLVEGQPDQPTGIGRPGTPLFPAGKTMVGIGVEINTDSLAGVALDLTGRVLDSFQVDGDFVGVQPEEGLGRLAAETAAMVDRLGEVNVVGATLAIPGIIDRSSERVVYAPNLSWDNVAPLEYLVGSAGDVPWSVDNDANLQAVAVFAQTQQPGEPFPESFLYLTGDMGIGGALVVDGDVVRGPRGWAGEIGHTTVDPQGTPCRCGSSGCLERYAGKQAIVQAAGLPEGTGTSELLPRLQRGDTDTVAAVERAGWALGVAIANAVNLLDVDTVVLGTSLAPLLPWLEPEIQAQLRLRVVGSNYRTTHILASPVQYSPATIGGALVALAGALESRL